MNPMSKFATIALSAACCFSLTGLAGCSEESKVKEQTSVSTPGGTSTTTKEVKVETTGSNPPSATTPGDSTKTTP